MPGIFYQPISRKRFLRVSAGALGSLVLTRGTSTRAAKVTASSSDDSVRMALLSDTHIPADATDKYRGFFPAENLQKVVPQVRDCRPRGVIISGDAARLDGQVDDYRALQSLLTPIAEEAPVYIGLGNHDHRQNFFKVFGDADSSGPKVRGRHVATIETAPVRIVVLDSLLYVNKVAGLLGKAQRTWLARQLAQWDDKPTVLFVHHTLGDGDGDLLDVDRMFRIISPHGKVKAIFYGHSHRYVVDGRDGIQLVNLPAVGYNFSDSEPVGWVEAVFSSKGVDLTLHAIGGNVRGDGATTSLRWG